MEEVKGGAGLGVEGVGQGVRGWAHGAREEGVKYTTADACHELW